MNFITNLFMNADESMKQASQGFTKKLTVLSVSVLLMSQAYAHGNATHQTNNHNKHSTQQTELVTEQILLKLQKLDRLANNNLRPQKQRKANQLTNDIRNLLDQLQQSQILNAKQFQTLTQKFRYSKPSERVVNFKRAVKNKRFNSNQLVDLLVINNRLKSPKKQGNNQRLICFQQQDLILSSIDNLVDVQNSGWWKERLTTQIQCKKIKKQTRQKLNKLLSH
jgi:hypothetical protein